MDTDAHLNPADERHIITESTDSDGEIYQAVLDTRKAREDVLIMMISRTTHQLNLFQHIVRCLRLHPLSINISRP
jgi:hypothetical protein